VSGLYQITKNNQIVLTDQPQKNQFHHRESCKVSANLKTKISSDVSTQMSGVMKRKKQDVRQSTFIGHKTSAKFITLAYSVNIWFMRPHR
jgi:hypothetical protein